jgi:hypothetical protein
MLSLIHLLVLVTSTVSIGTAQGQGFPPNPNCSRGNTNTAGAISRRQGAVGDRITAERKALISLVAAINLIAGNQDECQCEPNSYWVDVYNSLNLDGQRIQAIM